MKCHSYSLTDNFSYIGGSFIKKRKVCPFKKCNFRINAVETEGIANLRFAQELCNHGKKGFGSATLRTALDYLQKLKLNFLAENNLLSFIPYLLCIFLVHRRCITAYIREKLKRNKCF